MAGVAIGHHWPRRQRRGDLGELFLRAQPVGHRIVERGAVDVDRAGNVAIGLGSRRLLLAGKIARGAGIDERGVAVALDRFDFGQQPIVKLDRENPRRRGDLAALDRIGRRLPGGEAAVEDRDRRMAGDLEGPIDPRGGAEIGRAHTSRHDHDVGTLVDTGFADELLEAGLVRQHEWHAITRHAPAGLVVIAMHRARDMGLGVGLGAATVDRRADVEDHHGRITLMLVQPLHRNQGRGRFGHGRHRGNGEDCKNRSGKDAARE